MDNKQDQSKSQFRVRNQEKTSKNGDTPLKDTPTVNGRYGSNIESDDEQSDYIF